MSVKNFKITCPLHIHQELNLDKNRWICPESSCHHSNYKNGFKSQDGVPHIISNICDTICESNLKKKYISRSSKISSQIKSIFIVTNKISITNGTKFVDNLYLISKKPKVLIAGSAEIGNGTSSFLSDSNINTLGLDIYQTENVDLVADAHYLPFQNNTFDGVWIQAVLEHVMDPNLVVKEIFRVLKKDGIIYSEIPFMQPVHEGAYDFTRYTSTGHRFLFKNFEEIEIGILDGPAEALTWSIKYYLMEIFKSRLIANIISQSLYHTFIKPLSIFTKTKTSFDFFCGSYFLGRKKHKTILQKDVIATYQGKQKTN